MEKQKRILLIASGLAILSVAQMGMTGIAFAEEIIPESNTIALADVVAPSDVENAKTTPGDGKITLSWDASTDNVGVKGYKIYYGKNSVTVDGGSYTNGPVDIGNKISYELSGLTNGAKYFFAVTAYDVAGNESESYSVEIGGTPAASGSVVNTADTLAPKVVKVTSNNINTVAVVFSEAVKLPSALPQTAFAIKTDLTGIALEVKTAKVDPQDVSGKTVFLTTGNQKEKTNYILTAGIQIQDLANNPIVSGTSDTAAFAGTATVLKPAAETNTPVTPAATDTSAPAFVSVTAKDNTTVEISFSEKVVLKQDPRENFIITEEKNTTGVVNIQKVTVGATGMIVTLTTDALKDMNYNLIGVDVADAAGNKMSIENNATTFKGVAPTVVTPPTPTETQNQLMQEAAKDFTSSLVDKIAKLTWSKIENAQAFANFVIYLSTDKGQTYGKGKILDPNTFSEEFANLTPGMTYFFKLTTRDAAGKESQGLITSMVLPGTGPEIALLLIGSLGAGGILKRKKKTKK